MLEDIVQNFRFIRADWLWAFIPLILGVWYWQNRKAYSKNWQSVCDTSLLPYILGENQGKRNYFSSALLLFTGALGILSIAGPTWIKLPQPVFREQSAMVIALDLSRSMDATDITPSRLSRAKLKIIDILEKRKEGQTALLVFAQEAFIVSPLTEDTKTIESMVNSLSTDLMPSQGSHPDLAIRKAEEMFKQAGVNSGDILLITDGIPDNIRIKNILPKQSLYHLSVLGIGTEDGAPISIKNGGFLKDKTGAIIVPKIKEQLLRQLASEGGGRYSQLTVDDRDINYVLPDINRTMNNTKSLVENKQKLTTDIWQEEGPWILLLVIPFAALAFRKGVLAVLILFCLPFPTPSYAFEWQDLWLVPDQRGAASFKKGELEKAASQFKNKEWQAAAYYKNNDFEKTVEKLKDIHSADGLYNKGNALAKLGKLQEAIQAYDAALELSPDHEDAKYNKKLLEDLAKKQQQDQNSDDNQDSENNDSKNKSEDNGDQSEQQDDKQSDEQNSQTDSDENQQESQSNKENSEQEKDMSETQQNSASEKKRDEAEKQAQQEKDPQEKDKQESEQNAKDKSKQKPAELSPEQQHKAELLQANEQWLKRIPDDPGGLLRRKFRYQSKIRKSTASKEQAQW